MAKKGASKGKTPQDSQRKRSMDRNTESLLRQYIRTKGSEFLQAHNITSIGTGFKISEGKETNTIALQFTVGSKAAPESLESMGTTPIPAVIQYRGVSIPTDVLERSYAPEYQLIETVAENVRKKRLDPVMPGISLSHINGSAGTLGIIVYDKDTGQPYMFSNWHILDGGGNIGDPIVQPGPHDDNNVQANHIGKLVQSHPGAAGDCAIASIEHREFNAGIRDLGVAPEHIARVELGEIVVKSGRTTGVTRAKVRRVDVMVRISYPNSGPRHIGGFETGPVVDPDDSNQEISLGGDSGSAVLIVNEDGTVSKILAGLHFAGEVSTNPDEHAIACYAHSVFNKLNISLQPPQKKAGHGLEDRIIRTGFDTDFLSEKVPFPKLTAAQAQDSAKMDGEVNIPYTHFSINLCKSRGLARYVAWNIDGGRMLRLSRKGMGFRIDSKDQRDESLYQNNSLYRGHIARRADLCWGSKKEAMRANRDSFYFTNIAPQHLGFNQSSQGGLWGKLENAIFDEVQIENLKISVMGGCIFREDDPEYRKTRIPREFWKILVHREEETNK